MRHYASDVRCKSGAPDNDRCQYRQADGSWITYSAVDCDSDNDNDAGEDDGYCRRVAMPAYYYVYDASNGGCNGSATDNDCYDIKIVGNASGPGTADLNGDGVINADDKDERQNFANWYSFYRTRNLSAVAGAALAFSELDPSARVAWQSLNSCADTSNNNVLPTANCAGWKNNTGSNTINSFSAAGHKQKFYNWLFQLPTYSAGGGTPLRRATIRAGKYYSTSGEGSPYDNDFSAANSGEYTCRRNFHVLMTDGIWNDDVNTGNYDNKDWTGAGALPDATEYNYQQNYARIFRGATANTLADIAFNYWATDLRPGLANSLISVVNEVDSDNNGLADANQVMFWNPKNNPATWQHMINYTIGLGLTGFFQGSGLTWAGDTYSGSYSSIKSGFLNWPATSTDGGLVADLWHAAVNSRGEFFSADTPDELVTAFSSVMTQIKKATPSSAALAANSTKAEIGTRVYQAKFGTAKWNGHLYAYDVNPADGSLSAAVWDAATVVPAHGNRNLYTWNGNDGVGFQWANLTLDQQTALNTLDAANDGGGAQRLAWLRGDPTNETHNPGGVFRSRKIDPWDKDNPADPDHWVLGDIISSDPAYVGVGSQGYHLLPNGAAGQLSYAGYVSAHKAARTPAIYVGANDGMLHAFRVTDGVELFAVIPNAAFPNLSQLTDPNYEHRFFVNGSPGSGDAYLNNALSHASGWNTVVATGLGAGGNSVIAVDATRTDVTSADQFMWEYTEADMGMTYSQPQIVRLNDGSWAAVFGNGYKTSDGGAYLYLVNLADGSLIRKITASAALAGTDNGLSTPVLVDANSDMIMDYAYAGDLQGNLWKFDLSDPNAANWTVANGGTALFVAKDPAGNRQPITVQPTASKETNAGFWIFFGTGRYFADEDVKAAEMAKTQSFYGIWDNGVAVPAYANRTDVLVEQTIVTTAVLGGYEVRATSNNAVVLGVNVRGWFMDLPGSGERVVSRAVSVVSNVNPAENRIVFVTILPSSDPCDAGGTSWLMELLFTGGQPAAPVFDLNNDGVFDDADKIVVDGNAVPVSGVKSNVGIMATPTWLDKDAEKAFKLVPGTSGGVMTITNKGKGGSGTTTRVYWQQLL
jgi:type IV pilus assembly protein PilY1